MSEETSQQYLKSFQHVQTFDEDNLRDFFDVYLKEIASSKDPAFNGNINIAKGTTDPRDEFISQIITRILITQFQNFD